MIQISESIQIPETEIDWSFARAGGPGGQNVNKVSSKAILRWRLAENETIPEHIKDRLQRLFKKRITGEGDLMISSQRTRDQERNREDCLEKLGEMLRKAAALPKPRKATKPTAASKRRRLQAKRRRAKVKALRQEPRAEE